MQSFQLRVCRISVPENLGFLFIEVMGLVGIRISSPKVRLFPLFPLTTFHVCPEARTGQWGVKSHATGIPKLRITETVILE